MNKTSRGFTLVELLIVVVIIGILAATALPNFARAAERARIRDAQAVLAAIHSAERVYFLDQNNSYGTLANLIAARYLVDPDPGTTTNENWDFSTSDVTPTTFTATAARTPAGNPARTISINQDFDGNNYNCKGYDAALCP